MRPMHALNDTINAGFMSLSHFGSLVAQVGTRTKHLPHSIIEKKFWKFALQKALVFVGSLELQILNVPSGVPRAGNFFEQNKNSGVRVQDL